MEKPIFVMIVLILLAIALIGVWNQHANPGGQVSETEMKSRADQLLDHLPEADKAVVENQRGKDTAKFSLIRFEGGEDLDGNQREKVILTVELPPSWFTFDIFYKNGFVSPNGRDENGRIEFIRSKQSGYGKESMR